jgi:uncharacterized membrane protein
MRLKKGTFSSIWQSMANKPIHFFVITSLVAGFVFILLVPPFQIPDEFTHFTRSYEVSEFKTSQRYHDKKVDRKGSYLPKSLQLTYNKTKLYRKSDTPDVSAARKFSIHQVSSSLKIPLNKQATSFYDTSDVPAYFPLLYVPQAVAIKVLSLFNAPVILMLYATRLVGLLIWVIAGIAVLRIMRPLKYGTALASVMILPMFIAQASPSTDPILNGLTIIFLALVAKSILAQQEITKKMVITLAAMVTIMALAKPVYLVFGLLGLLLPTRYKGYKAWAFKLALVAVPFVLYAVWSVVTKDSGGALYVDSIAIGHADPSAQVGHLFPNVFNFVEPFVNTLFLGWGDGVTASLMGVFGKLDTPLPLLFIILGYVSVAVAIFAGISDQKEDIEIRRSKSDKWLRLLIPLVAIAFIGDVYIVHAPEQQSRNRCSGKIPSATHTFVFVFCPKKLDSYEARNI